ncbi:MAG: Hsp20/alpha crystallin family protein [Flavobacteriales bacterium]|nr:Hsp20/alpha crystallin family protein [Flavobacteriales bacterium]
MTIKKYRTEPRQMAPFGSLFNDLLANDLGHFFQGGTDASMPSVNISTTDKEFFIHVLAPGFEKDRLKVDVKEQLLTIAGEAAEQHREKEERSIRKEFILRSFARSFRLPEDAAVEGIAAQFRNGILELRIPRMGKMEPEARKIAID